MNNILCADCRSWFLIGDGISDECRRRSPLLLPHEPVPPRLSFWPATRPSDWCSEAESNFVVENE
jgi:hypothetical protein